MKNRKKREDKVTGQSGADSKNTKKQREQLRRRMEGLASFGLILVCLGLVAPFAAIGNLGWVAAFKWIYTAGALIYIVARVVRVGEPDESFRVRRLRRLEIWAGIAFAIGAFFWFWNTRLFGDTILSLKVLQETILFTMVGAMIQIVSGFMLSRALSKESQQRQ